MPSLIEPGTKYFFNETLKNVNKERNRINTLLFNLALFVMFILIVYGILSLEKNKLSVDEMKKKEDIKNYLLNKVKELQQEKKKDYDKMITEHQNLRGLELLLKIFIILSI